MSENETQSHPQFGWIKVPDRHGPCINPFQRAPHSCTGTAVQNVNQQGPEDRMMCLECYGDVMGSDDE